jgi:uncharacterized membrane protein YdjX (TVP38/TMEM64 family)
LKAVRIRILATVAVVLLMVAAYRLLQETGAMAVMADGRALRQFIVELGVAGPLAVIGLMTSPSW